jgi:hypothetical protein
MSYYQAKASAPGKAIIFGEHAVVYGVNAIAAALSDLRIIVDIVSIPYFFHAFCFDLLCSKL